nr:sugar hydrolase [Bacilli bacterium]
SGDVSSSWLQEELVFIDEFPMDIEIKRRHAFRYVEIYVVDTSNKYQVALSNIHCIAVSSADYRNVPPLEIKDEMLKRIDEVSLRTMHECMQTVFEDGPKRDRRLWMGDFRLQALGNYATFKNADLVKRCLYLFAGSTVNEGKVGACLFTSPKVQVDDTVLFDYSLFFVSTLKEYYDFSGDKETLRDLFPTAKKQIELSLANIDANNVVIDHDYWWCFLDWEKRLNKQAGAHAIFIIALKDARAMAMDLGEDTSWYDSAISLYAESALKHLYNKEKGFFVSGGKKQISWASQIWFVLAGILSKEENISLLNRMEASEEAVGIITPFMHHYYVEALLECGMKEKAIEVIKSYWGAMVNDGADTFYELFDENDPKASPYGNYIINSFCHAWSGTPSYFIRHYLK